MADLLDKDRFQQALARSDGWTGASDTGITKRFTFKDFKQAMSFVNQVAEIAEELRHHPDISISWSTVDLKIVSHRAQGVTEACFNLAHRIDQRFAGDPDRS